jgi:hypothetical protein
MSASVFAVKASSLSRYNSLEGEGSFTSGLFMKIVEFGVQHYIVRLQVVEQRQTQLESGSGRRREIAEAIGIG